jgi:putative hydrolase of the HAD superfamily
MSGFDAALCDVDGVLRLWDPDGMPGLDRAYGLPVGTLAGIAFAPERLQPAITGRVTDGAWRRSVAEALVGLCGSAERAQALTAEWSSLVGRVDKQVLEILTAVRRHIPVVLVSNATTRLEDDLAQLGLLDAVDVIVSSARVGAAKPDPAVYTVAAERAGASINRCLFVDDTLGHVTAAQNLGMTGHHYRHAAGFRDAVSARVT